MTLPDLLARRVAAGHHHLQRRDGVLLGYTDDDLRHWVRTGLCTPLGGGAYVINTPLDGDPYKVRKRNHLRRASAVLAGLPGAYLVGHSAALAHGLPVLTPPDAVEISRNPRIRSDRKTIQAHAPWGETVIEASGLACQSVAHTIVGLAARHGLATALVSADAALHRHSTSTAELIAACEDYGTRRGVTIARRVASMADARIESPGESLFRLLALQAGIRLTPQVTIHDEHGGWVARVDFVIEGSSVVVEFDGLGKYRTERDLREEKLRQNALERLGYTVVRVLNRDLERPDLLVGMLRDAVRRAHPVAA